MSEFIKAWACLKMDRRAVTALEYGLIAGVLVAGIAAAVGTVGTDLTTRLGTVGTAL
jgi:pilus assembly protein Flp/PilA